MAAVNVGLLGGAFDPPHVGHVALARAGVDRFALDRLLVRVVADPGHKDVATAAAIAPRARASSPSRRSTSAEVALDPFARTVDSLEALALDDPVFLLGADEFADAPAAGRSPSASSSWRGSASRRGRASTERRSTPCSRGLARPERVTFFELEPLAVSSSAIRALARGGRADRRSRPGRRRGRDRAARALPRRLSAPGAGGTLRADPSEGTRPT